MNLSNMQIYQHTPTLLELLKDEQIYIPIKINFLIVKNTMALQRAYQEIEQMRLKIASHYGAFDSKTHQYIVASENVEEAYQEINDLLAIEQTIAIQTFNVLDLGDISLTPKQMQALMLMIEE